MDNPGDGPVSLPTAEIPELEPREEKDKERRGGAAPFGFGRAGQSAADAARLGAARLGAAGASRGSSVLVGASRVPGSPFQFLLDLLARATGLNALAASKAGMAALLAAALSAAAGVAFYLQGRAPGSANPFSFPGASASSRGSADASGARGAASSIDMFRDANPNAESQAAAEAAAAADEAPPSDAPAPAPETAADAPDNANRPANVGDSRPRMVLSPFGSTTRGSGGGGMPASGGVPAAGRTGPGGDLVAMRPAASGKASGLSGQRRPGFSAMKRPTRLGGRGALDQARATQRLSSQAARMGRSDGAATTASQPFDAGAPAGAVSAGGIPGGGVGTGGAGVGPGRTPANANNAVKETPPPPPVGESENKTPWQGLLYGAVGALILGMILLFIAQHLANKGKEAMAAAAGNPIAIAPATQMLSMAKMLAMVAAGCGVLAAGLGAMIMGPHGQKTQGLMFVVSGGFLAVMAVKVLMDSDAAEKTESKITDAKGDLNAEVAKKLDAENGLKVGEKIGDGQWKAQVVNQEQFAKAGSAKAPYGEQLDFKLNEGSKTNGILSLKTGGK